MRWLVALKALLGIGHRVVESEKEKARRDKDLADQITSPEGTEASREARLDELENLEEAGL